MYWFGSHVVNGHHANMPVSKKSKASRSVRKALKPVYPNIYQAIIDLHLQRIPRRQNLTIQKGRKLKCCFSDDFQCYGIYELSWRETKPVELMFLA